MNKILVPVDFSTASAAALRFATYLSEATGLQLSVIHVYNSLISSNRPETPEERAAAREALRKELRQFTEAHVFSSSAINTVETILAEGVPPVYIKWRSQDENVAFIIMGGIGTGVGGKLDLFGGIAQQVSDGGGCPVILIPRGFTDELMRKTAKLWRGVAAGM
ncbi:nucleotide-binding universal stress UspA family protein [Lewinella aquimaris]|uniref:Nucleotide-binding universal stress UspA family protein n=1 Tax=Neolewinella aquimaris TaxID=1835722 RepID=A0A840E1W5_9BACT|nr:universal stress protein [Neolewinella aquimaris]MBB4079090.1 nucleotide-binding universal stress UspA family protein [Neolewinella aquimaris]